MRDLRSQHLKSNNFGFVLASVMVLLVHVQPGFGSISRNTKRGKFCLYVEGLVCLEQVGS